MYEAFCILFILEAFHAYKIYECMMRFVTFSFCVLPSISVGGFMENKSACGHGFA